MSLERILARIEAGAQARVEAIRAQAAAQAEEILAEARAAAEGIRERACREAAQGGAGDCAQEINQARFEAVCAAGNARETLVEEAMRCLREQLMAARRSPDYQTMLARLLLEALPGERGGRQAKNGSRPAEATVEADPRDRALIEQIASENRLTLRVEYVLDCWGGVNVRMESEQMHTLNTIESRLERAAPYLRQQIAARLAAEQDAGEPAKPEAQAAAAGGRRVGGV